MTAKPDELTEARELLGMFDAERGKPGGIVYLRKALLLLADIRAFASEKLRQIASNLTLTHARKVQREVESLLSSEPSVHWETVDHWEKVFTEFERSGFTLPQEVADIRSKLWAKKIKVEIGLMLPSERKELLEKLQATST